MEGSFEAKLTAKRETKDGIFLTLSVNPADYTEALAMLRVNATLMVGWAETVDASVQALDIPASSSGRTSDFGSENRGSTPCAGTKDRRPFSSLPLSQQAGIRCNDAEFHSFIKSEWPDHMARLAVVADVVRDVCGKVSSRAEFDTNETAAECWEALEAEYQSWLTDAKWSGSKR